MIALTVLLLLAQECLWRAGRWVVWGLFLAVPAALTPYWFRVNAFGPFVWVKFYTVFFCAGWGAALRFTPLGDRARSAVPVLLAVNILEATILDALGGGPAHALNAAAGVLLAVTLPYGRKDTAIDAPGAQRSARPACRFPAGQGHEEHHPRRPQHRRVRGGGGRPEQVDPATRINTTSERSEPPRRPER